MLSIDLRENPGYAEKKAQGSIDIMKYGFLKNIRQAIAKYYEDGTRVKLEWIYPNSIGQ